MKDTMKNNQALLMKILFYATVLIYCMMIVLVVFVDKIEGHRQISLIAISILAYFSQVSAYKNIKTNGTLNGKKYFQMNVPLFITICLWGVFGYNVLGRMNVTYAMYSLVIFMIVIVSDEIILNFIKNYWDPTDLEN